jgi:Flp pilus assembly protein TadD
LFSEVWRTRQVEQAKAVQAGGSLAAAADLARVELGIAAGDTAVAEQGLASLRAQPAPNRSFALARSLAWFQYNTAALAEVEPLLTPTSTDIDALILAAELAVSLGRGDDAERWLNRAHELDPFDDRPYSRMLVIYGVGGVKADSAKLNQTVRELRDSVPDSRTLRGARAKELARRSLLAQAESEALHLAEEDPTDAGAIDLLFTVWRARAERDGKDKLDQGREWLESQLTRRPGSPALFAGLSTIMVAQGDAAEAADRLQQGIEAGGPPDLCRMREKLLRDDLSRPDESTALALARLQGRPRTIAESIELAEVLCRAGDDVAAARDILTAATDDVTLAQDQEYAHPRADGPDRAAGHRQAGGCPPRSRGEAL